MTRIEFLRSTGRWVMGSMILATSAFLLISGRISGRNYCGADADCGGCGLRQVCPTADENKAKPDEKE